MDNKIINDTTTEKVLSLGGMHSVRRKRSVGITVILVIAIAGCIGGVMFIPWKSTLAAVLTALAVAVVCCIVYFKVTAPSVSNEDKASVIRTGDTFSFHYEFDENGFTVSGSADRTVNWSDVSAVRNIGGAYQIKCLDTSFTVKKQGFKDGGDEAFGALLEKKGIRII